MGLVQPTISMRLKHLAGSMGKVIASRLTNGSSSIEVIESLDHVLAQGRAEGRLRSACYLAGANGLNRLENCLTETFILNGIPTVAIAFAGLP